MTSSSDDTTPTAERPPAQQDEVAYLNTQLLEQANELMQRIRASAEPVTRKYNIDINNAAKNIAAVSELSGTIQFIGIDKEEARKAYPQSRYFRNVMEKLATQFEELALRTIKKQKVSGKESLQYQVTEELRPAIYRLLALECFVNAEALGCSMNEMASVTLYHGCIVPDLLADEKYKDLPQNIVKRAVIHNPINPTNYLDKLLQQGLDLAAMPKYKDVWPDEDKRIAFIDTPEAERRFSGIPSMIKRTITINPTNPELFLDKAIQQGIRLAATDEFRELWLDESKRKAFIDTPEPDRKFSAIPFIIKHAVAHSPKNPAEFLASTIDNILSSAAEERYAKLWGTERKDIQARNDFVALPVEKRSLAMVPRIFISEWSHANNSLDQASTYLSDALKKQRISPTGTGSPATPPF